MTLRSQSFDGYDYVIIGTVVSLDGCDYVIIVTVVALDGCDYVIIVTVVALDWSVTPIECHHVTTSLL